MCVHYFRGVIGHQTSLRYHMCDLHSKFEEDGTNTAVAIESDSYFGHRQTYTQVISYLSIAMHCIGDKTEQFLVMIVISNFYGCRVGV